MISYLSQRGTHDTVSTSNHKPRSPREPAVSVEDLQWRVMSSNTYALADVQLGRRLLQNVSTLTLLS